MAGHLCKEPWHMHTGKKIGNKNMLQEYWVADWILYPIRKTID
jgi:hypothetical protein